MQQERKIIFFLPKDVWKKRENLFSHFISCDLLHYVGEQLWFHCNLARDFCEIMEKSCHDINWGHKNTYLFRHLMVYSTSNTPVIPKWSLTKYNSEETEVIVGTATEVLADSSVAVAAGKWLTWGFAIHSCLLLRQRFIQIRLSTEPNKGLWFYPD